MRSVVQDCGSYLWGNLVGKVYRNTPHIATDSQNEIRNVVAAVPAEKFQRLAGIFSKM
jgi:hypothetical protein